MVSLKLAVLFTVAAVVAFASSVVGSPTHVVPGKSVREDDKNAISTPDYTDDYEDVDDKYDYEYEDGKDLVLPEICILEMSVTGEIQVKCFTDEEMDKWLDEENDTVAGELGHHQSPFNPEAHGLISETVTALPDHIMEFQRMWDRIFADIRNAGASTAGRHKRWASNAPRLLSADRALFKGVARTPEGAVLEPYTRPGNFQNANQHFIGKSLSKNRISGRRGRVGKRRVAVRDRSKQGRPTLMLLSPNLKIREPKSDVDMSESLREEGETLISTQHSTN